MPIGKRIEITVPPGVNKDDVSYTSMQYVDADKIRFYKGYPQKIGGWSYLIDPNAEEPGNAYIFDGVIRSIYSFVDPILGEISLFGTNSDLYAYNLNQLDKITPVSSDTVAVTNMQSYFITLSSAPVNTQTDSPLVYLEVSSDYAKFRIGDIITVSGIPGDIGGISVADLNGTFNIAAISGSQIAYYNTSGTLATSYSTGGGGSVVLAATLMYAYVDDVSPYQIGEEIQISASTDVGGIVAADINISAQIRFIDPLFLVYNTISATAATSEESGGGGSVELQSQIDFPGGACDFAAAYGYGLGYYNSGNNIPEYGIGYQSVTGTIIVPQIWSFDRYNANIIMTPGNQQGVYTWTPNSEGLVPTLLENAPEFVNYVFTANNQVIVFGSNGTGDNSTPNVMQTSTVGDPTLWDSGAYLPLGAQTYTISNTGRLIAHATLKNQVLLFSNNSVQVMTWSNTQFEWVISDLFLSDGLIGPKAVISFNNIIMWVGNLNWYIYNGAIVSVIPKNTLRQWFYSELNDQMSYKVFVSQNIVFDEIWIYFPSNNNVECDSYIIWSFANDDYHFTNGTLSRTATENPSDINRPQFMAYGNCNDGQSFGIQQELISSYADFGNPMTGHLTTNDVLLDGGNMIQSIERIIPSNTRLPAGLIGNNTVPLYDLTVQTKEYDGQRIARQFGPQTVTTNTDKLEIRANGRQWNYKFDFSNTTGFRIEKFYAELKPTTQR